MAPSILIPMKTARIPTKKSVEKDEDEVDTFHGGEAGGGAPDQVTKVLVSSSQLNNNSPISWTERPWVMKAAMKPSGPGSR